MSALPAQVHVEHAEVNCNGHRVFIPALRRPRRCEIQQSEALLDICTQAARRSPQHVYLSNEISQAGSFHLFVRCGNDLILPASVSESRPLECSLIPYIHCILHSQHSCSCPFPLPSPLLCGCCVHYIKRRPTSKQPPVLAERTPLWNSQAFLVQETDLKTDL